MRYHSRACVTATEIAWLASMDLFSTQFTNTSAAPSRPPSTQHDENKYLHVIFGLITFTCAHRQDQVRVPHKCARFWRSEPFCASRKRLSCCNPQNCAARFRALSVYLTSKRAATRGKRAAQMASQGDAEQESPSLDFLPSREPGLDRTVRLSPDPQCGYGATLCEAHLGPSLASRHIVSILVI